MTHKRRNRTSRILLITISTLFVGIMLILPLVYILARSLGKGIPFYISALRQETVYSALKVTLLSAAAAVLVNTFFGLAASWLLTRYSFRGKQVLGALIDIPFSISPVIAGLAFIMMFGRMGWAAPFLNAAGEFFDTEIKIVFALPGVILATIFVTFPFISREIIPVLQAAGTQEEEAAALMGANGFTIFRKITFPHIKWAMLYGIVLCAARAMGEFGAVNALSKTRGQTFNLPQEIDALYLSGTADSTTAAFAVSSILVVLSIGILVIRSIVEYRGHKRVI